MVFYYAFVTEKSKPVTEGIAQVLYSFVLELPMFIANEQTIKQNCG